MSEETVLHSEPGQVGGVGPIRLLWLSRALGFSVSFLYSSKLF